MIPSSGQDEKTVVGLDVGTTKICAVVGREERGRTEIVAVGLAPSVGLKKGVVVDPDSTVASIREAVADASKKADLEIHSAYVGIAGGHIKGFSGRGAVVLKDRMVRGEDIERLMASAGAVYVPVERDILHVIPAGFRLDGHNGIIDPIGLSGSRLEANVHIVTGSVASVRNLVSCCERADVEVLDIVLEPLASAEAVLNDKEKNEGVVLVDIGGGTTDVAFYRGGVLRHTAVLALGGNHLTNDIAVGFGVSSDEAEKIKIRYGYAALSVAEERGEGIPEAIKVRRSDGQDEEVPLRFLATITRARCEEFIGLVKKELENVRTGLEGATVVLTGGTALLRGIRELAEEIFELPVRIGIPEGVLDRGLVHSPIYATGVGLVWFGLGQHTRSDLESAGILERMRNWVNGFFDK